jgi:hypothetical protein
MCVKIAAIVRALPGGLAARRPGKMLDNQLVHALIDGKDPDRGPAGLSVNLR